MQQSPLPPENTVYYRIALLNKDNVWRYSSYTELTEQQLPQALDTLAYYQIPDDHIFLVRTRAKDKEQRKYDYIMALERLNAGQTDALLASDSGSMLANPPLPQKPKPQRSPARRTQQQNMVWDIMEQSTGPVKDEPYIFRLPLDKKELQAWFRLSKEHKEGAFEWEFDEHDPRNSSDTQ